MAGPMEFHTANPILLTTAVQRRPRALTATQHLNVAP